jgi:D-serine deaminase-like pyridoxal phosphate-dependent protein
VLPALGCLMHKTELDTPVVLVDLDRMEANIRDMADFARSAGVKLRPHVKTHKIPEIARHQLRAGATGVTVAKIGEAEVMADAGIEDIFIAYEIIGPVKTARLLKLARKAKLRVAVDSIEGASALSEAAQSESLRLAVMIEVNGGLHRCGVLPGKPTLQLAREVVRMPGLNFKGIFTHVGYASPHPNEAERARAGRLEGETMAELAASIRSEGIEVEEVSVGSTPTAKIAGLVEGITEIRPGTYVFYCLNNVRQGVVRVEDCALTVQSMVISRPAPDRAIIDAGSKMLSSDKRAFASPDDGYGAVKGYPDVKIVRLNEEHGFLQLAGESRELKIGDQVELVPNHVCPVVNLQDQLVGVRNGQVEVVWDVAARGKTR